MKITGDFWIEIKRKNEDSACRLLVSEMPHNLALLLDRQVEELQKEGKQNEILINRFDSIRKLVLKVEGLENLDGSPMSLEDFQKTDFPLFFKSSLCIAYRSGVASLYGKEEAEKK